MTEEIESGIHEKFEILQIIGKGAYGIVWKAIDRKTSGFVALKKVFEAFQNETDAQRTFREVLILMNLKAHENIIRLIDVIKAENKKDLYLVFDYMQSDLHQVIKTGLLKSEHKQFIIYQILKAMKYLHSGGIFHRDLKPSNILINSDCQIKVCDFGLARSTATEDESNDSIMTEYVATRWYRAPEIVLGSKSYTKSVDMWSIGCILAELINGNPIFPGKSTYNQLELILEVLGKPSLENITSMNSENARTLIENLPLKSRSPFTSFFKTTDAFIVDFLRRSLEFDPNKRMTVEEALSHGFVKDFREIQNERVMKNQIVIPNNDKKLSIKAYRDILYSDLIKNPIYHNRILADKNTKEKTKGVLENLKERSPGLTSTNKFRKLMEKSSEKFPTEPNKNSSEKQFKDLESTNSAQKVNKFLVGASETNFSKLASKNSASKIKDLMKNYILGTKLIPKMPHSFKTEVKKVGSSNPFQNTTEPESFVQKLQNIKSKLASDSKTANSKNKSLVNLHQSTVFKARVPSFGVKQPTEKVPLKLKTESSLRKHNSIDQKKDLKQTICLQSEKLLTSPFSQTKYFPKYRVGKTPLDFGLSAKKIPFYPKSD